MMTRFALALALTGLLASPTWAQTPVDLNKLKQKPISADGGKVGQLLKQWWADGTASGNAGDFYDNRDGDHSPLDLKRYPQLSAVQYSAQDIKLRMHWAAARIVRPHVTFGNSSTSAPAHLGGSNPRSYYVAQAGLSLLYDQYAKNNLYIYPEHRDHDPGHNGVFFLPNGNREEGYGDMYPTNTPYLIISQGSSGSDQPFMRMMPHVLAAFRPEVKKKLTEAGLLMPTIQMLLRSTNKHLKDPKEYLTGKAHPTVFEGSWVDELAMMQKAHDMDLKALPPMVQMRVIEEDKAENGVDFCDRNPSEVIANTPACIARVHRSRAYTRRLVIDAGASYDVNKAKLTYTWVVSRGDSDKIKIVPKKADQSVVEITVAWHDRRPVSPGSPLESNRVDIGLFVHNGTYYSAPGFVTICTLDREARRYNSRGVLLDIAHGMGETEMRVAKWDVLFNQVATDRDAAKLLQINDQQALTFKLLHLIHVLLTGDIKNAHDKIKTGEAKSKDVKDDVEKARWKKYLEQARADLVKAQNAANEHLNKK
ncbi:MAG: hypothetical protein HYR84_09960, partial [Planctomycetes bacterium]|nr:hypothetical protein [Planctomycetota bacterium]